MKEKSKSLTLKSILKMLKEMKTRKNKGRVKKRESFALFQYRCIEFYYYFFSIFFFIFFFFFLSFILIYFYAIHARKFAKKMNEKNAKTNVLLFALQRLLIIFHFLLLAY